MLFANSSAECGGGISLDPHGPPLLPPPPAAGATLTVLRTILKARHWRTSSAGVGPPNDDAWPVMLIREEVLDTFHGPAEGPRTVILQAVSGIRAGLLGSRRTAGPSDQAPQQDPVDARYGPLAHPPRPRHRVLGTVLTRRTATSPCQTRLPERSRKGSATSVGDALDEIRRVLLYVIIILGV